MERANGLVREIGNLIRQVLMRQQDNDSKQQPGGDRQVSASLYIECCQASVSS